MALKRRISKRIKIFWSDITFQRKLRWIEGAVARVLSLGLIFVIFIALADLGNILIRELITEPYGFFNSELLNLLGLFLNILIAMELLENIKAYLNHQGVQLQLVVATALIAVSRKLIIFNFAKSSGIYLLGLAAAIFSLSISYWLVRQPKE